MFQELQIFAFVCTYLDAGQVFLDFVIIYYYYYYLKHVV